MRRIYNFAKYLILKMKISMGSIASGEHVLESRFESQFHHIVHQLHVYRPRVNSSSTALEWTILGNSPRFEPRSMPTINSIVVSSMTRPRISLKVPLSDWPCTHNETKIGHKKWKMPNSDTYLWQHNLDLALVACLQRGNVAFYLSTNIFVDWRRPHRPITTAYFKSLSYQPDHPSNKIGKAVRVDARGEIVSHGRGSDVSWN